MHQAEIVAELDPQRAQGIVDHLGGIRAEEDQIAILRPGAGENLGQHLVGQEFHDRRLQALAPGGDIVDLDVGQPLGAVATDEFGVQINLAAAQLAAVRHAQRRHPSVGILGRRRRTP